VELLREHKEALEISLWGILVAMLCLRPGETRENFLIIIVCASV